MGTSVDNSSKKMGSVLSVSSYMTKKVEKFRFIIYNITSLLIEISKVESAGILVLLYNFFVDLDCAK
jgi:hypothetical protein